MLLADRRAEGRQGAYPGLVLAAAVAAACDRSQAAGLAAPQLTDPTAARLPQLEPQASCLPRGEADAAMSCSCNSSNNNICNYRTLSVFRRKAAEDGDEVEKGKNQMHTNCYDQAQL